jgi:hypothetical protein
MRARERDRLFEMVNCTVRDARPHPEERARRRGSTSSNARTRVSKDEDEPLPAPSCFETHRSALRLWKHLRLRRAATLLSMRARARRALAKRSHARDTSRRTNLHVWSAVVPCLRIVLYNENTNSNVWAVRERRAFGQTNPILLNPVVPARTGPMITGRRFTAVGSNDQSG